MEDPQGESPGVGGLLGRLAARRAARPEGRLPRERFVTGGARRSHGGLVTLRRILSWLAGVGLAYSSADLARPLGGLAVLSGVTVGVGALLMPLPLFEIALGAGTHWEVEYRTGARDLRKHRFEASLHRFADTLPPLVVSILAQLAGFASLHAWASQAFAGSYSQTLGSLDALYYSLAAFSGSATSIVPLTGGARLLTGIQMLLGWLAGMATLGTILAWVVRNRRPRKPAPSFR
jgi:hypothetical protein